MDDENIKEEKLMQDYDVWLPEKRIASRRRIFGTGTIIHEAYEPFTWGDGGPGASHATITTFDGTHYGTIVSARFSRGVEGLPSGLRTAAIENFRLDLEACAYGALMEAFPYLRKIGRRHKGQMIVQLEARE